MNVYLQNVSTQDAHGYRTYRGWYRRVDNKGPSLAMVNIRWDERHNFYFGEVWVPGSKYYFPGSHTSPYRFLTLATLWVAKFFASGH